MTTSRFTPDIGTEIIVIYSVSGDVGGLLERMLEHRGYFPLRAASEKQVLSLHDNALLSALIIMDRRDADTTKKLSRSLRQRSSTLPIIVVMERPDEDRAIDLLENGVDQYILPPFRAETLLRALNATTRRQRSSSRLEFAARNGRSPI